MIPKLFPVRYPCVAVRFWGSMAHWSTPHLRAHPFTLPVMSPSNAHGLMRALFWKPEFEWEIDEIHVHAPIRHSTMRRKAIRARQHEDDDARLIQTCTHLVDVNYVVIARVIENPLRPRAGSHHAETLSRMRRGEQFKQPYLGHREFAASWELIEGSLPLPLPLTERLGRMPLNQFPLDLGCAGEHAQPDNFESVFFTAAIDNGVLYVPAEPYETRRTRTFAVRNRAHLNNRSIDDGVPCVP